MVKEGWCRVPVAVATAQAHELVLEDGCEEWPHAAARKVLLSKASNPQLHSVHGDVGSLERALHRQVAGDLGKGTDRWQLVRNTRFRIARETVVTTALNVEGGKVMAGAAKVGEQEAAYVLNDLGVDLLATVAGQVLEHGLDARLAQNAGVEERVAEAHLGEHSVAVVVQELQVGAQHAVAQAKRGGTELGADAGVDAAAVAGIRREICGAENGGQELRVRHLLKERNDAAARALEQLFVGQGGVCGGELRGDAVVLANKEDVERAELGIFVAAHVAGEEQVAGVGQAWQQVDARAAIGHAAGTLLAEGGGQRLGFAVHLGAVDEGGEGVELLARVGGGGARGCVEVGAGGRHGLGSGGVAVEHRVAFGNVECHGVLGSSGISAHHVMV
jgi:hypothetical protein